MKSVLCVFPVLVTNNNWQEKHMQCTKLGLSVYLADHECKCKRSQSCFSSAFLLSLSSPVISSSLSVIHPPAVHKKLPCHTEILKHYPCCKQKKRAIKRFYTLVLRVLHVQQRKRERVHVCVMRAVWLQRSRFQLGPFSVLWDSRGSRRERQR